MFSNVCWCINYALIAPLKLRFLYQSFTPQKKNTLVRYQPTFN